MLNIRLICVGKLNEGYFVEAQNEYLKRLKPFCDMDIAEINECRIMNETNRGEIDKAIKTEGTEISKKMEGRYNIALCIEGDKMDSSSFAQILKNVPLGGMSRMSFIIGSSWGLSEEIKDKSNLMVSFSDMTFPHRLMRIILLEQIYRGFAINTGLKYHK